MDTDTSMEEGKQPRTINNRTSRELLHEMLFLLRVYCNLEKELPEAENVLEARKGIDFIRIMKDRRIMGMPNERWNEPLEERVLVFDDELQIIHNCLIMKYGYSERLDTIFYWTTEMKTHYFEAGKNQ